MGSSSPLTRRSFLVGAGAAAAAAALEACGSSGRTARPLGGVAPTTPTTPSGASAASTQATQAQLTGPAVEVDHGSRDRQQVALTFHWGPPADLATSRRLLDEAARAQVPITVFAVGQWFERHPDLAAAALAAGHELDNHTYTHPALAQLSQSAIVDEIRRGQAVLAREAPNEGRYFRPSGTDHATSAILTEAGAAGYAESVGFDVDPRDYTDPGADAVVRRVRAQVQPGSIISMHFGHDGTVVALPRILADLRARGLTPVLLRDLLS